MTNEKELKERMNKTHNKGICECCDNWSVIASSAKEEVKKGIAEDIQVVLRLQELAPKDEANRGYCKALTDLLTSLTGETKGN